MSKQPSIQVVNGHATTTSLRIAEHFGKKHFHVLRAIKNLECSPEFRASNFGLTSKPVQMPSGGGIRNDTVCTMTRDGFVFLAMGFTGKEAAQWKEAYIAAFNTMEAEIAQQKFKQAALPVVSQIDHAKIERINKRAWNLAQAAYEDYRARMKEDPLVRTGGTQPEDWQPIEASKDVLELIRATAATLAAASRAITRRGDSLERLVR